MTGQEHNIAPPRVVLDVPRWLGASAVAVLVSLLGGCGARTPLFLGDVANGGTGGEAGVAAVGGGASVAGGHAGSPSATGGASGTGGRHAGAGGRGGAGAAGQDTAGAAGTAGTGGQTACDLDDLTTWGTERYRDQGDYERAAVALSGEPWVALKVRNGNIVLRNLGVDAAAGIVVHEEVEIADSPVYPVALDVDAKRFVVLTTSGINWNGDVALWRIDRQDGTVTKTPIGNPPSDPAYTVGSALGLVGDDVVVAYTRFAEHTGAVELRDDHLDVVTSVSFGDVSFTAVKTSATSVDVYLGDTGRLHVEGGAFTNQSIDPMWPVIGGLDGFLVEAGNQVRMTQGESVWSAAWPHTQISPPAVARTHAGRGVFSLETELTAVVGYPSVGGLSWMRIESAPDASGIGVGLFPVLEDRRLGLFYLGLEIPHPEQPLRYYGRVCH